MHTIVEPLICLFRCLSDSPGTSTIERTLFVHVTYAEMVGGQVLSSFCYGTVVKLTGQQPQMCDSSRLPIHRLQASSKFDLASNCQL